MRALPHTLRDPDTDRPAALVGLDTDTAWRLCTRSSLQDRVNHPLTRLAVGLRREAC